MLQNNQNKKKYKTLGLSYHRLYHIWNGKVKRCGSSRDKDIHNYGGRGITVCEEWLSLPNFIADMDSTFQDDLTLDRENVNLGYNKTNCRWVTRTVQARNTRKLRKDNTSGYRGVRENKLTNKWVAVISVNNKAIHLGTFTTKIEAAEAYDDYVLMNRLEHTLNFEF